MDNRHNSYNRHEELDASKYRFIRCINMPLEMIVSELSFRISLYGTLICIAYESRSVFF